MNQYTYKVPFTEDELVDCYINQGMTQQEIAKHFGTTQKVVWRAMHRLGIPTRQAVARNQTGPANNNWRGGRRLEAKQAGKPSYGDKGYWYVYAPNHPNATKMGYVAEHIKVATEAADRPLQDGECVHHVDLDKQNNQVGNLAICTYQQHARWHQQLEEIAIGLFHRGLVRFDPEHGYRLVE